MDQTAEEASGIEFTVTDRQGRADELSFVTCDPDEAIAYFQAAPERYQAVVWRFGRVHGWRTPPDGGPRIPAILRCPEFSRVQALAYRKIEAHLLRTCAEDYLALFQLMRYYGYYPDVAEAFRQLFQLEIVSPLADIVRCVDFTALARELTCRGSVQPLRLDDPELPPGIFLFRAPLEFELDPGP